MRKVSRSALVPFSASRMFALVDDIEAYPEFLPWCSDAVVDRRDANIVDATLEMHRAGLKRRFTTRNTSRSHHTMSIALHDGPFRHLAGTWQFSELGTAGCKVSLDLEFEFESRVMDTLLGPFFEEICNSLVDAFTRRAGKVYDSCGDGND